MTESKTIKYLKHHYDMVNELQSAQMAVSQDIRARMAIRQAIHASAIRKITGFE